MNRAERRRQERAKIKGEKVLQVKRSDLDKLYQIYDGLNRDYVGFDDIAEAIQRETGIDLVGTDDGFHVLEGKKDGNAS